MKFIWLLVKAVTGGASDGYGKKTTLPVNIEPEQMNQKPNETHMRAKFSDLNK